MTVKELNKLLTANNIPEDARLMSDSGWECCATDMDGVYYNPKENIVVFTQEEDYSDYCKKPEWVKLEEESENKKYDNLWMLGLFCNGFIKEKITQLNKEAEEAGMTLTKYLESISPLNHNPESEEK